MQYNNGWCYTAKLPHNPVSRAIMQPCFSAGELLVIDSKAFIYSLYCRCDKQIIT